MFSKYSISSNSYQLLYLAPVCSPSIAECIVTSSLITRTHKHTHTHEINILLVTKTNQLDVKFTKTTLIKLRENHISRLMNRCYSTLSGIIFLLCYHLSEPNNRTTVETKNILMEAMEPGYLISSYPQKSTMYSLGLTGIVFLFFCF